MEKSIVSKEINALLSLSSSEEEVACSGTTMVPEAPYLSSDSGSITPSTPFGSTVVGEIQPSKIDHQNHSLKITLDLENGDILTVVMKQMTNLINCNYV